MNLLLLKAVGILILKQYYLSQKSDKAYLFTQFSPENQFSYLHILWASNNNYNVENRNVHGKIYLRLISWSLSTIKWMDIGYNIWIYKLTPHWFWKLLVTSTNIHLELVVIVNINNKPLLFLLNLFFFFYLFSCLGGRIAQKSNPRNQRLIIDLKRLDISSYGNNPWCPDVLAHVDYQSLPKH